MELKMSYREKVGFCSIGNHFVNVCSDIDDPLKYIIGR